MADKKRAQIGIAAIALVLAAAAAAVLYFGMTAILHPMSVVEAAANVAPMTRITAADLTVRKVPRGQLGHTARYTNPAVLVGQYALYGLYPGEIVSPTDLLQNRAATYTFDARLIDVRAQARAALARAATVAIKAGVAAGTVRAIEAGKSAPPAATHTKGQATAKSNAKATAKAKAIKAALSTLRAAVRHEATMRTAMAVTVSLQEPQGFAIVHTGDHVTVFGTIHDSSKRTAAYTVGNHVLVLGRQGGASGGAVHGAVSGLLVLALSPLEIERMMLAQQAGSLLVALNAPTSHPAQAAKVISTSLLGASKTGAKGKAYGSAASATSPGAVVPSTSAGGGLG